MKWDELQYNLMLALAVILPPLLLMLAYQDLEHNTQAAREHHISWCRANGYEPYIQEGARPKRLKFPAPIPSAQRGNP